MKTFLLFSILSPQGVQTLAAVPERLFEVNREVEAIGGRVVKQWALLGSYDFLSVVEAPDEETILRLTTQLGARGSARFETLVALTADELIAMLEEVGDPGEEPHGGGG